MPENDTPTDTKRTAKDTPTSPKRTAGYRSAITSRPAARLDGNSAVGRRVRDLFRAIMTRLDEPADPLIVADCLALAELKTAAEVARVNLLEKGQSSNECVRLENLVRRAEVRVGLEAGAGAKVDPPDWRDLLVGDQDDDTTEEATS
jgi:hypothetical protein